MKAEHQTRSQPARWLLLVLALVVVAGVAIGATVLARSGNDKAAATGAVFTVSRGPLTISVSEAGTIKSREQAIIKSEVEGQNTILYLVQEGTRVKEGELLIELDVSQVSDEKISQEILVRNADAAALGARETLAVTESQAKSDNDKAKLDYDFAVLDLKKYLDGDYPNEVKAAESKIGLSGEKVERAIEKYNWSQKLFGEKFLSDTELKADKLAMDEAKLSLDLAKNELTLLKEYTYKRKLAELESMVVQTKDALERTMRKGKADIAQADATKAAKEAELERQQSKLTKMNTMLSKSKMFAPTEGLVVYATTDGGRGGGGFRFNQEPLAEGSTVRERQELIYLPTTASMMASIKVHESSLDKVRPGLPVRITVDALPGKAYTGRVAKIAPMPDSQNAFMNPDLKVYNTEIHIDGDGSELRTGMSCRAEIVVEWHENATYVPVQSVVRVGGKPTVYVQTGQGVEPRTIDLGLDNNRMAHILKGLEPGEQVLLNPPLQEAAANNESTRPPEAGAPTTQPVNGNGMRPTTRPSGMMPMDGGPRMQGGGDGMRGGPGGGEGRQFSGERRQGAPGAGEGGQGTVEGRQGRRSGGGGDPNMTQEQRDAARKQWMERMEKMTPEERQQVEQRMRERGGTGAGGGARRPRDGSSGGPADGAGAPAAPQGTPTN